MSLLARYPLWQFPFFEEPAKISRAERGAAFEAMLAARDERITALKAAAPTIASAVDALLDSSADPVPPMHTLERWWEKSLANLNLITGTGKSPLMRWLSEQLRTETVLRSAASVGNKDWYKSDDREVAGFRSLIGDLAVVLGEALARRRADFAWAIDDDEEDAKLKLPQAGRVVVMKAREGDMAPICFEFYWSLLRSYEMLFGFRTKTMEFKRMWHSDFAGWQVVNAVNGWCDPPPPGELKQ